MNDVLPPKESEFSGRHSITFLPPVQGIFLKVWGEGCKVKNTNIFTLTQHTLLPSKCNMFNYVNSVVIISDTENLLGILRELMLDRGFEYFTQYDASDAALALLKAGAQKLHRLYWPYIQVRPLLFLHSVMPETLSNFLRCLWVSSK